MNCVHSFVDKTFECTYIAYQHHFRIYNKKNRFKQFVNIIFFRVFDLDVVIFEINMYNRRLQSRQLFHVIIHHLLFDKIQSKSLVERIHFIFKQSISNTINQKMSILFTYKFIPQLIQSLAE